MKHLLEYDDHDIKDLLGDLEGIGQAIPAKASLWIQYSDLDNTYDAIRNISTDAFYASGDEDVDALKALQLIVDGKFDYIPMEKSGSFPKSEIQAIAKDYLTSKDTYKQMYTKSGETGNALDAFANDLAIESLDLAQEFNTYPYETTAEFKVFIAPPGDPSHRKDEFYVIPNPTNVIEYKIK